MSGSVSGETRLVCADHGMLTTYKGSASGVDPNGQNGLVDFYNLDMSNWWFAHSPNDSGIVAQLFASQSCLGGDILNYEHQFGANVRHLGGPATMSASQSACYTGVIE